MSTAESQRRRQYSQRTRRDGWTPERQLRFLAALQATRSVSKAARAAGMSRESAYRLRARPEAALFAAAWDTALTPVGSHKVGAARRRNGRRTSPIFRAKRAKVTKFAKFTTPGFDTIDKELRELFFLSVDESGIR